MKLITHINPEDVSDNEAANYRHREAARAVVYDESGKIAVLHATKYNYYKLPGGGIEKDESPEMAVQRECLEEIGCNIEITGELGKITEYRKKFGIKQTSYCYTAKLLGKKGMPQLMEDEAAEGFQTEWMTLAEALDKVRKSKREIYEAQYMIARDSAFLEVIK